MAKFVRDVGMFVAINVTMLVLLFVRYGIHEDYLAAANDKLRRLESTEPPRILLVGGSSMAWSTNSPVLETTLRRQVINCAYHAGLGLGFREAEVMQCARPTDVVVLSIEWGVFPDKPRPRIVTQLSLAAPQTLRFMNGRDRKLILDGILPAARMPLAALAEDFKRYGLSAYSRASARRAKTFRLRENFNGQGDFTGHYGVPPFGFEGRGMEVPTVDELARGVERLNRLHAWCRTRKITLVYLLPFIPESFRQHNPPLEECLTLLKNRLTIPILNPDEFVMPDDAFFDSAYHLQEGPGKRRSERMATWLAAYLSEPALP